MIKRNMRLYFQMRQHIYEQHKQLTRIWQEKKNLWSESASELYRPSDCRLSAK
jgi:hypothetical protein